MPVIASWIRKDEEKDFDQWVAPWPNLRFENARPKFCESGSDKLSEESLLETLDLSTQEFDALLLTGGPDISPEHMKRVQTLPENPPILNPEPIRDRWEFAALQEALSRGVPILAICKGHQLLNVGLGGSLLLDIPGHREPEDRTAENQPLRYDSRAASGGAEGEFGANGCVFTSLTRVNSSHHQAIDKPGSGLVVDAWSASDSIIEQVHLAGYAPGCVGVQFHPERGRVYAPLFRAFFEQVLRSAKQHSTS